MSGINNDKAMKSILEGVDYMIKKAIKDAPSDKIYVATVLEAKNNNLYKIQLKDKVYDNIPSLFQDIIQNEPVRVVVPQNNYNQMFILGKHNMDSIGDYNNLKNKPQINGVELKGNKTAKDLGLVSEAMLAEFFKDREYKAGEYTIYQGEMYKAKKNTSTTKRFFKPEYEINKAKEQIILDDTYNAGSHHIYWSGNTDKSGCICWYSPSYQNYPPTYVGGFGTDNIMFAMVSPYEDCTYYRKANEGKLLPTYHSAMQYAEEKTISEIESNFIYGSKIEAEDGTSWWLKILNIQNGSQDVPHIFTTEEENKRFVEGLSQVFHPFDWDERVLHTQQVLQIILDQTLDEQQVNVPPYDTTYWEKIPNVMSQIIPLAREYNDLDTYNKGDYVTYDGCLYKLTKDTNDRDGAKQPPTNSEYWQKIDYLVDEVINYINLRNKPKINGHELIGDKSTADLEILPPIASKTQFGGVIIGDGIDVDETGKISIDGEFLPTPTLDGNIMIVEDEEWTQKPLEDCETDPTVPQYVKDITEEDIEKWNQGGEIPIASVTQLGGVKIGSGITITEDGTISAQGGGGSGLPVPTANDNILVSKGTDWEQKNISTSTIPSFTKAEYELLKDTIPTGTRFIITDDNEPQTAIRSGGLEIYSGAWIATQSSDINDMLTEAITIPKGKYLVIVQLPEVTNNGYYCQLILNNALPTPICMMGNSYNLSYNNAIFVIDATLEENVVDVRSAFSGYNGFREIYRGWIKAIKLDTLFDASAPSDIYSTDEKVIGKWINGKPLYQKTYEINLDSENYSFNIDVDFEYINYDIVTNNSNYVLKDTFNNSSDRLFCYIYVPAKSFVISTNTYYFGKCYVTIQYTKTTD